jgi:hypothetical protein
MTIAPAVCADIYPVERRAFGTSVITLAQCLGPASNYTPHRRIKTQLTPISRPTLRRVYNRRSGMALGWFKLPQWLLQTSTNVEDRHIGSS